MRKKEARQIQLSDAPTRKGIYPFVAIVVLLSACILSFHLPGSFTQDSFFVLNEALSVNIGHFSEWFSPTYVLIWKAMIAVAAALHLSPFVQVSTMCTLQTVLIVGALVQLVHTQANITWGATAGIAAAVIASPAV